MIHTEMVELTYRPERKERGVWIMAMRTAIRPHDFIRAEFPYDDCQICQLPERNTRLHPGAEQLTVIPDYTEPIRQLDFTPAG